MASTGVSMILGGSDGCGLAQRIDFPPAATPERSGGDPLFHPPNRVALCQARSAAPALGAEVLSWAGVPGFLAQSYSTCHGAPALSTLHRSERRSGDGKALQCANLLIPHAKGNKLVYI